MTRRCYAFLLCLVTFGSTLVSQSTTGLHAAQKPKVEAVTFEPTTEEIAQTIFEPYKQQRYAAAIANQADLDALEYFNTIAAIDQKPLTVCGTQVLPLMSIPQKDFDEIATRQAYVRELVENKEFSDKIEKALTVIRKNEAELIKYWNPSDNIHETAQKLSYNLTLLQPLLGKEKCAALAKKLNQSSLARELSVDTQLSFPVLGLAAEATIGTFMGEIMKTVMQDNMSLSSLFGGLKTISVNTIFSFLGKSIKAGLNLPQSFVNLARALFWMHIPKAHAYPGNQPLTSRTFMKPLAPEFSMGDWAYLATSFTKSKALGYAAAAFMTAKMDMALYTKYASQVRDVVTAASALKRINSNMYACAQCLGAAHYIQRMISTHPSLQHSPLIEKLAVNPDLYQNGNKNSIIYGRGAVLATQAALSENKETLVKALEAIGEIDALLCIAKVYRLAQETKAVNPWSFAQFDLQKSTPFIGAQDFWLPLIAHRGNTIKNTFVLGNEQSNRHCFFSGPNSLGKTTAIKNIAMLILFAQSWGIVPASTCTLTPFKVLASYLAPQTHDDVASGVSSFMAEKNRVEAIQNLVKKESGFCVVLVDEPYRGTLESLASERVENFCSFMSEQPHAMTFIATHLVAPITKAEDTTLKGWKNYSLDVIDQGDNFTPTFKIVSGPAAWWFHDAAKRTRFISWLETKHAL